MKKRERIVFVMKIWRNKIKLKKARQMGHQTFYYGSKALKTGEPEESLVG